jgi:hypothetical protein
MNTEFARKEIGVRLFRETIYTAVNALIEKKPIPKSKFEENDRVITLLGEFIQKFGSKEQRAWEKKYTGK